MALSDSTGHQYNMNATSGDLAKALLQKLPEATVIRTELEQQQLDATNNILKLMEKLDGNISKEFKESNDHLADIVKILENCCGNLSGGSSTRASKAQLAGQATEINLTSSLLEEMKKMNKNIISGGGGGGGGNVADMAAPGNGGWKSKLLKMGKNMGGALAAGLTKEIGNSLDAFGLNEKTIFKGAIVGSLQFNQKMRQIMYSVEGTGVALTSLEKQWLNIGKTTEQTGMMREVTQEAYMKHLRKGMTLETKAGKQQLRTAKDTLKMVTNTLRTANVIDASAEDTVDLFAEWNRQLGLTNSQMGSLGRSMEMISRSSGVTGNNLLEAAKAAQQTIKSVRDFGGINERAMAKIIEMQVQFKKFGSEDVVNEINTALAGGIESVLAAKPQLQVMISRASQAAGLGAPGGHILGNADDTQKFYKSLGDVVTKQVQDAAGMGNVPIGKIIDNIDRLNSGSKEDKQKVTAILNRIKVSTGMGLGEVQNFTKGLSQIKSFEEKMTDIDNKLKTAKVGSDLFKQLMVQKRDLRSSENFGKLTDITRKFEYAEGPNRAAKMQDVFKQLKLKGNVGDISSSLMGDMRGRAKGSGIDFDKLLAESGHNAKSIDKAFSSGTFDQMQEAMAALQEVENKIMAKEKAKQDPVTQAQFELAKVNDTLRDSVERLTAANLRIEHVLGLMLAAMTLKTAGSMIFTGWDIMRNFGRGRGGMPGAPRVPGGPNAPTPTSNAPAGRGRVRPSGRTTNRQGIPLDNVSERIEKLNTRRLARGKGALPTNLGKRKGILGKLLGFGALALGTASVAGDAMGTSSPTGVGGNPMAGMPGFGGDCVPVCIVGGWEGLKNTLTGKGGMGGIGTAAAGFLGGSFFSKATDAADLTLGAADVASDVKTVANAARGARGASTLVRGADTVGDVARGAGTLARGADVATDVAKAGGFLSKIPGVAKFLPALRGVGAAGGKVLPFLGPLLGAATGALESATGDSQGRGMIESTILGALTGDSKTGSMFSGMLGIEQGSTADELMGLAGSTLGGAATGAALGTVLIPIPGVGTAIGAAVGAALGGGAETYKILTNPDSPIRKWAGETMDALGSGINTVAGMMGIDLMKVSNDTGFTDASIAAAQIWEGNFSGAMSSMGNAITKYASMSTFGLSDTIMGWASNLGEMAGGWMSSMGSTLGNLWEGAQGLFSNAVQGAATLAVGAYDTVSGVLGTVIGAAGKGISDVVGSTGVSSIAGTVMGSLIPGGGIAGGLAGGAAGKLFENMDKEKAIGLMSMLSPFGAAFGLANALFGGSKDNNLTNNISPMKTTPMIDENTQEAVTGMSGRDLSNFMTTTEAMKQKGLVNSTKSMYVSESGLDSIKGGVNTVAMSADDMETYVAQQSIGSSDRGTYKDPLFSENEEQLSKFDSVIALLKEIRDRTGASLTMSIPGGSAGSPSMERSGIKQYSKDRIKGTWPLQSGAFQPTQNYTGD